MEPRWPGGRVLYKYLTERCPQIPSPSTGSGIFVQNVYLISEFSFILGLFWSLVFEKFRHVGNVANLKNIKLCIFWSTSTVSKEKLSSNMN